MKKVTRYETSDGKLFIKEKDAEAHEEDLKIGRLLARVLDESRALTSESIPTDIVVEAILEHRYEILSIINTR